ELRGDAFVPEPAGNLVKRYTLRRTAGLGIEAVQAYEGREFLTSTDERFRPVNAFGGPDGALYLVDFYRGVIQHRVFVTSFLRKQILDRGLQQPVGLGRIWRVVREDVVREGTVLADGGMSEWGWTQLVGALSHPDGWMRDTAQRVIVDTWEEDSYALGLIETLAVEGESALGRMTALWTLEGVHELDQSLVLEALDDPDPRVQHAAVRVAEPFLSTGRFAVVNKVYVLALRTGDARLEHQCLLSLGAVRTEVGESAIADLMTLDCSSVERHSAALSGLHSHELSFLERLLGRGDWIHAAHGRERFLRLLARCVVRGGRTGELERLVTLAATRGAAQTWQTRALCEGLLAGRIKGPRGKLRPLRLGREPRVRARLASLAGGDLGDLPIRTLDGLVWPGKPGVAPEEEVLPLSAEAQDWFRRGRITYTAVCTACHQPSGLGEPGKAPSLRGSEWVLGSERRLVRILAHGMSGPLRIDGRTWDMEMPALAGDAEELSGVLTYVRREWGHGADPISPQTVRTILEQAHDRSRPWTVEELLEVVD
ncbi:MAG: c-type cytochrome, partial [Planctomycetota bacterium]